MSQGRGALPFQGQDRDSQKKLTARGLSLTWIPARPTKVRSLSSSANLVASRSSGAGQHKTALPLSPLPTPPPPPPLPLTASSAPLWPPLCTEGLALLMCASVGGRRVRVASASTRRPRPPMASSCAWRLWRTPGINGASAPEPVRTRVHREYHLRRALRTNSTFTAAPPKEHVSRSGTALAGESLVHQAARQCIVHQGVWPALRRA